MSDLTLRATVHMPGGPGHAEVRFHFDPADPLVLVMTVGEVGWHISREVAYNGCTRPTGSGDVFVTPYRGSRVAITLYGHDDDGGNGAAVIEIHTASTLLAFLRSTYREVSKADEVTKVGIQVNRALALMGLGAEDVA